MRKINELMALFNECLQEAKDFGHLDENPARNAFVSALEAALKPGGEFVARVDDLERGGRVRALAMGLALDAPLFTAAPPAQTPVEKS